VSRHAAAILEAVFVTFLWSTSWVLIKLGLKGDLPPLTFAGVRYTLASLVLVPWVLRHGESRRALGKLDRSDFLRLAAYGLILYTVTQGMLFVSLAHLPANPVSLVLNLTPVFVAGAGLVLAGERPTLRQSAGVAIAAAGVAAFFLPVGTISLPATGVTALVVCLGSNVAASIIGRSINRRLDIPPLTVTLVSMTCGSLALLIAGLTIQGTGTWRPEDVWIVAWLAIVNTALTFTLWNHTLRTLTAVESSVLNGLMLPQIVLLAFLFLGETISGRQAGGLVLAALGAVIVQWRRSLSRPQLA
jgi:drug/metabolite transporter (DMT)-like permease